MGTRALVKIKDGRSTIACIYRQFDGYPEGLGKELTDLIGDTVITNGFNSRVHALPGFANGMGCVAAYLVSRLKGAEIGNVYLMPPNTKDVGEEYVYTITQTDGRVTITTKAVR